MVDPKTKAKNRSAIDGALERQKEMKAAGYRYNSSDLSWKGPNGDTRDLTGGGGDRKKKQGGKWF